MRIFFLSKCTWMTHVLSPFCQPQIGASSVILGRLDYVLYLKYSDIQWTVHVWRVQFEKFDVFIHLWNHHYNRDNEHTHHPQKVYLWHLVIPHSPSLSNHWPAFFLYQSYFLNYFIKMESYRVYFWGGLIQHNYFEIYPCCCTNQ